jgi:biotin-dependent carboxylase-like uncharacterized protein
MTTLSVVSASGLATVQDLGRRGFMHMGVPVGGALVPALCAHANAAARNHAAEALIELVGAITVRAETELTLGTDDGRVHDLLAGDTFTLAPSPHVRYLAVRGGLAVPIVLGGRGTLLAASLGGHHGRVLRKGDTLPIGDAPETSTEPAEMPSPEAPVHVLRGPDVERFASGLTQLLVGPWRVGTRRDRAGVLLTGALMKRLNDAPLASAPMVRGAIQVPPSGEPIVLGPDHPTTGGYPVVAVIASADLGSFFMRSTGAGVHFALA